MNFFKENNIPVVNNTSFKEDDIVEVNDNAMPSRRGIVGKVTFIVNHMVFVTIIGQRFRGLELCFPDTWLNLLVDEQRIKWETEDV